MGRVAVLLVVLFGASGCAAIPLAALGTAAMSSGASSAVKLGTEVSRGGTVSRTFSVSEDELHDTLVSTFDRLGIKIIEEERTDKGTSKLTGQAYGRRVHVAIEPVTPVMSRLRISVRDGIFADRATAGELMVQTERTVDGVVTARVSFR